MKQLTKQFLSFALVGLPLSLITTHQATKEDSKQQADEKKAFTATFNFYKENKTQEDHKMGVNSQSVDQKTGYFLKEDFLDKLEIPFSFKEPTHNYEKFLKNRIKGPIFNLRRSLLNFDDRPSELKMDNLTFFMRNKSFEQGQGKLRGVYELINRETGDGDLKESCSLDVLVATDSVEAFKKRLKQLNGRWTAGGIALVSVGALTIVGGGIFGLYYFNQQPTTGVPEKKEVAEKDSSTDQ